MNRLKEVYSRLTAPSVPLEEQNQINLAMAISLSEQGNEAIQVAPLDEATALKKEDVAPPDFSVAAIPQDLRKSLMLVEEGEKSENIVKQEEENLVSPSVLSFGGLFDGKIERIASRFNLSSLRGTFLPRVISDSESVDEDELTKSKRRLQRRLKEYTLVEYTISGDGNCQFASLSDQLYRTPKMQGVVRSLVVKQLMDYPEFYSRFVPGNYEFYCWKMSQSHVWGDHLTLQAAADKYGIQISLITSYKDSPYLHIMPREIKTSRILWLSFLSELHYNSLYTHEDIVLRRGLDAKASTECVLF
jgi:hypothetical protein